jgi:glycerophosphoryl diester phosphodiesterase
MTLQTVTFEHWPYPRWIAHRGAGKLVPENTLEAFQLGARYGYRMFECDAKLSADGIPFLLHDATLDRTTNGVGPASARSWRELSALDAGSWHSAAYAGAKLPTLESLMQHCLEHGLQLNIEIKPTPGEESETGQVVAEWVRRCWSDASSSAKDPLVPPLLTSFQVSALASARSIAPQLPRGLLLDELWTGWQVHARQLDCVALVCHHRLWNAALVQDAHQQGWRALSYTVNDEPTAARLLQWGVDGLITDRVDHFAPDMSGTEGQQAAG